MRAHLTSAAWRDLHEIGDRIARDDPVAAIRLTDALLDRAREIGDAPLRYPEVPEFAGRGVRKRSHRDYVILYRAADRVEVLRIVHARRDYLSMLQTL